MGQNAYLKSIDNKYADELVSILNNDDKLQETLSKNRKKTHRDEFMKVIWQKFNAVLEEDNERFYPKIKLLINNL